MKHLGISCGLLIACWALLAEARCQERLPQVEISPPPLPPKEGPASLTELPPPARMPFPVPEVAGCPAGAPCPARTVSVPSLILMEEQKATTVPKLNVREVVVGSATALDVAYQQQRQTITEWTLKPREVIQLVPCTTLVPVTVTDPCTGQCRTEYKECPTVREVKIVVMDPVPVAREVAVSVPCLKPGQPLEVRKLVVDKTIEPAICSRFQLLTMPNEVPVPVCPPGCPVPHP